MGIALPFIYSKINCHGSYDPVAIYFTIDSFNLFFYLRCLIFEKKKKGDSKDEKNIYYDLITNALCCGNGYGSEF